MKSIMAQLRNVLFPVVIFAVIGLLVYGPSLGNAFVSWDDTGLIYGNPTIKGMTAANIHRAFTTYDPELYIPLTLLSWQVDYAIGGLNPLPYHAGNLLLHGMCAVLALLIVSRLTGKQWMGWLVGALFLVHPLHTEAVAWASARKDVLSTALCLAAWLAYIAYAPAKDRTGAGRGMLCVSIVLFALALLAKVSVVLLPLVLLLTDWYRRREWSVAMYMEKVPYVVLSILFVVIALFGKQDILVQSSTLDKILMAAKSTIFYVEKLFVPMGLTAIYPYTESIRLLHADFLVPAILTLALVALTLWLCARWREAGFCLAFFLLSILPSFSNFTKHGELYYASDRYAYLASIGIFLLLALVIERVFCRTQGADRDRAYGVTTVASLVVLAVFAVLANRQSAIWSNSESLFRDVVAKQPQSVAGHLNLSIVLRETGRLDEALTHAAAAGAIRQRMEVFTNLANIYKLQGRTDAAAAEYRKAMAAFPNKPEPYMGLGILAQEAGEYQEAIDLYSQAIEREPRFTAAYVNLASVYEHQGKYAEAETALATALDINPKYADGWFSLGIVHESKREYGKAAEAFAATLALNPAHAEAPLRLAAAELSQGHNARALELLKGILKQDPQNAGAKALINKMIELGILGTK